MRDLDVPEDCDLILANPPYVPSYDAQPLYVSGGRDGMFYYDLIVGMIREKNGLKRGAVVSEVRDGGRVEGGEVLFRNWKVRGERVGGLKGYLFFLMIVFCR